MASARLARNVSDRNPVPVIPPQAEAPRGSVQSPPSERRGRSSPTPHLTRGQYRDLLAFIDSAGVVTLDGISRALPRIPQPISAVFDLCDAGILNVDWEAAFDGDMHVWRIDG